MIIVNYEYEPKNQLNKRAGTFDWVSAAHS